MRTLALTLLWATAMSMPLGTACAATPTDSLSAGAAKADITPMPGDLSDQDVQTYAGVHDALFARALVLSNGDAKVVLISVDSSGIPDSDSVIDEVATALAMPRQNVLLTETRVHNTPSGGESGKPHPAYFQVLERGILAAVRQADQTRQPARIGFGTGKAYVNTNRDQKLGDHYIIGYNPSGPSDKTVAVLLITDAGGKPIAIYSTYAVHPVVMYLAKSRDGKQEITADLTGATANFVEAHFPGAVALFTMSAGGDQNPLFMGDFDQQGPDLQDEGAGGWALVDVQARRLGAEIERVVQSIRVTRGEAALWGAMANPSCPARPRVNGVGGGGDPVALGSGDHVAIPLSLLMIDDIAVAGVGADIYTDIATRVKQASLFPKFIWAAMLPREISNIASDSAYAIPQTFGAEHGILQPGCAQAAITRSIVQMQRQYRHLPQTINGDKTRPRPGSESTAPRRSH